MQVTPARATNRDRPIANARTRATAAYCPTGQRYSEFCRRRSLRPLEIEMRTPFAAVSHQRALLADGVRTLKNPVLPRGKTTEDFRLQCLGAGGAQVRFHSRQRIGRAR